MKTLPSLFLSSALLTAPLTAATVVVDDFESGSFSTDWAATAGTITATGGAAGSTNFVALGAVSGALGATFVGGATDFTIDFYTRTVTSTARQFNLQVSTGAAVPNVSAATVNLRYEGGAWAAFNGVGWQALATLNGLTPGQWHHVRLTGNGWGSAGANFDVQVSDAGGSAFTSASLGNVFYQTGNPNTTTAASFNFNTNFGANPGFAVDQVSVNTIPEPAAGVLAMLGLSVGLLRRRRA